MNYMFPADRVKHSNTQNLNLIHGHKHVQMLAFGIYCRRADSPVYTMLIHSSRLLLSLLEVQTQHSLLRSGYPSTVVPVTEAASRHTVYVQCQYTTLQPFGHFFLTFILDLSSLHLSQTTPPSFNPQYLHKSKLGYTQFPFCNVIVCRFNRGMIVNMIYDGLQCNSGKGKKIILNIEKWVF